MARSILTITILLLLAPACRGAVDVGYGVEASYPFEGTQGWDLLTVDAAARRVYVSRGDHVLVLDADSGRQVGEIADTAGVHGIALAPELGVGFTSNGKANSLTVFALADLAPQATVKVTGDVPDVVLYEPVSGRVYAFNGKSGNATVVDARKREVVATIALSGKPEFAVADAAGRIYVNLEDKSEVAVIEPRADKVAKTWKLEGCEEPTGLALDRKDGRLFAVCQNKKMLVLDSRTGKRVAEVAIGAGPDGLAYDEARRLLFSPNGADGTITIVRQESADRYSVVADVPTQKSARTIALDAKTHRLWLPAAEYEYLPVEGATQPRRSVKAGTFRMLVVGTHAAPVDEGRSGR